MKAHFLAVPLAALILGACGGGSSSTGTLRVGLTDAPACGFDAVNVTVEKVRVHRSAGAADDDGGWSEIVLASPKKLNLLDLTNGVVEELGQTPLPAGKYTQMRLVLAENGGSTPLANSVVPTGSTREIPLQTPSGQQSGLKMNVNIDVADDEVAEVVIDFDACKSVVPRGSSGQYNLKPVLSVVPVVSSVNQRVVGYVAPAAAEGYSTVSLQLDGVPIKSTVPDATTGRFELFPVPVGTYDLVITGSGKVTAVMTGVPVSTTEITTVSTEDSPIDPPSSTLQRDARGSASIAGSNAVPDATVRALQAFTTGPTVEVASQAVNALTGDYAFTLAVEAPVKAAYAADGSFEFEPDIDAAARYRLEATAPELTAQTKDIDLSTDNAVADFIFP